MAKVYFKLDLEKDISNWWGSCNSQFMGVDWKLRISPKLRKKIIGKDRKSAAKFLKPFLKKLYRKDIKFIHKFKGEIKEYWAQKEEEIFKRITLITKKPIWPPKIVCYYTTFPRGMYRIKKHFAWMQLDPKAFYTKEIFCSAILHEIFHFQFHKYFWEYCKTLGMNKIEINNVKEAVTFLLNKEFLDLIPFKDRGYKIHSNFRKDLSKIWHQEKNFRKLLKKASTLIKGKYSYLVRGMDKK